MKTRYSRHMRVRYIRISLIAAFVAAFFLPNYTKFESTGDNFFAASVNGEYVGSVGSLSELDSYIREVRKGIASESEELIFMDVEVSTEGSEVLWGQVDDVDVVKSNIDKVLRASTISTMTHGYTVKVNEYSVNLASLDEVKAMLQACLDKYGGDGNRFVVELENNTDREFNILTPVVVKRDELEDNPITYDVNLYGFRDGGIAEEIDAMMEAIEPDADALGWSAFEYGLISMDYAEEIEVVETYIPSDQLKDLSVAIDEVTKEQEKDTIYTVVPGDTLSGISLTTGIPVDRIIELNKTLDNEFSILHIDDELKITVPEPEISVIRQEQEYIEESYDEEIIVIPNDDWYTTQQKTLQEPSAGFRKIVAIVNYSNDNEIDREVVKEEVVIEAVPKIIERGTITPPTYVKPISGGSISSGFGYRRSPTRGASSYHQGVDWYTPVGTPVYASSAGVVTRAGWGGGYGYCVYISHPDGRETRYAHLSKVLCSVGQQVDQGTRIASSGNTGISTGPHLHFEMRIGGTAVNPLNYLG